jgi:hypothetical protein
VACRGEIVTVSMATGQHSSLPGLRANFSDNSHRISSYVLHSPKSTSRTSLPLPPMAEIKGNAFKRLPGAKKRKSRKGQHGNAIFATSH